MSTASPSTRRWAVLVATIWIQAFTGTNFDFSAYSSNLKAVLGISQVQLNYLAVASDLGKALGWSSGLALLYLPVWSVLVLAAGMGLVGYVMQWLLLAGFVSLHYFQVFFLCLLSGCSICWFNTVCFVLCIRNFPSKNRPLALSLTVSFNGVSAVLFTLMANAVTSSSSDQPLYLLINAIVPLLSSFFALFLIFHHHLDNHYQFDPKEEEEEEENSSSTTHIFLVLYGLAFLTGVYLLFLNSISPNHIVARMLLAGAILLLVLPLFVPSWIKNFTLVNNLSLRKALVKNEEDYRKDHECQRLLPASMEKDKLVVLGEEHSPKRMVKKIDFWLYYVAYFCGATVGLVYSNNLGQIAQSLGHASETTLLVSVYSACSFFGRLLSAAPDFLQGTKLSFGRTTWLAMALVPTPLAFFLLAATGDGHALLASTALVGLSSGFIFAAAVSVTAELFGPNSIGFNHNILITNIPLGSLLYGLLAAMVYDANGNSGVVQVRHSDGMVVCMGRACYVTTFVVWGCITLVGLTSSTVLLLRTRSAYGRSDLG